MVVGPGSADIRGAVESTLHVTVRDTGVAALPHASMAVHVLVCDRAQPFTVNTLSVDVGVTVPQPSDAVAVPSAALIAAAVGLQPRVKVDPVAVITGAVESTLHVTVRDTGVAALPHASIAVHVLLCDRVHPFSVNPP